MLIFSALHLAKQPIMLILRTKVQIDVPYERKSEYWCPLFLKVEYCPLYLGPFYIRMRVLLEANMAKSSFQMCASSL